MGSGRAGALLGCTQPGCAGRQFLLLLLALLPIGENGKEKREGPRATLVRGSEGGDVIERCPAPH